MQSNWIKDNPLEAIGIAVLVGSFLMNGGFDKVQEMQAYGNQIKEQRAVSDRQLTEDKLSEDALYQRSELAQERMDRGCFQVYTADGQSQSVIQEGMPIYDLSSGQPLPNDVTVCDKRFGITAVIQNGVASDLAVVNSNPNEEPQG